MNKARALKILNVILFVLLLDQLLNTALLRLWDWGLFAPSEGFAELLPEIHEWNGVALFAVIIGHLILNFSWIKANFLAGRKAAR